MCLLVSLWFRGSYREVLQRDTNVGTGTLEFPAAVAHAPRNGPNTAQAAFSSPSGLGARTVIEPPAFSTAAAADLEAP
jgi:hypothetical protein